MTYTIHDKNIFFESGFRIEVKQKMRVPQGYVGIGKEYNDGECITSGIFDFFPSTRLTLYDEEGNYKGYKPIPREWPKELKKIVRSVKRGKISIRKLVENPQMQQYLNDSFEKINVTSH